MAKKTVLVAGASGLVGFAAMRALAREPGTRVIATSRRRPLELYGAEWVQADLTDPAACQTAFGDLAGVTHLVFAALFELPELYPGWTDTRQIETNGAMLRNLFEPLRKAAKGLRHVTLLQGTKAYGAHVQDIALPARPDRDEAKSVPNFYWVQEDYLRELQAKADWQMTIIRPQVIFGLAIGAAMNPISAIGVYGALLKEQGRPLSYTGGLDKRVFEGVHADLVANAIVWAGNTEKAGGQSYNLTNGDVMVWQNVWPAIADALGMEVGERQPQKLAETMPPRAGEWARIVEKYGLKAPAMDAFVNLSFQYCDLLMAPGVDAPLGRLPAIVSTINLHRDGFPEVMDSEDMLRDCFDQFRQAKLLPPL